MSCVVCRVSCSRWSRSRPPHPQANEGANLVSGTDVSISCVDFASATSFLAGVNQAVGALNCTSAYAPLALTDTLTVADHSPCAVCAVDV
jgi:hypothetical protein